MLGSRLASLPPFPPTPTSTSKLFFALLSAFGWFGRVERCVDLSFSFVKMASKYKDKDTGVVFSFNGQWVSWAHTAVAYSEFCFVCLDAHGHDDGGGDVFRGSVSLTRASPPAAFLSALIVGVSLHYNKIVQNEFYGYPDEWFPSVSATIGDRYPERSFFMLFIAITSGAWRLCGSFCIAPAKLMLTFARPSLCSRCSMVPAHTQKGPQASHVCRVHGFCANIDLRRLDLHYVD